MLGGKRGRHDGLADNAQAGAALLPLTRHGIADRGKGLVPGARLAKLRDRLRTVGIVERQDRGLAENIGGAAAGGMIGIALDLGRPAHVAFHQQTHGRTRSVMLVAKNSGSPGTILRGGLT